MSRKYQITRDYLNTNKYGWTVRNENGYAISRYAEHVTSLQAYAHIKYLQEIDKEIKKYEPNPLYEWGDNHYVD